MSDQRVNRQHRDTTAELPTRRPIAYFVDMNEQAEYDAWLRQKVDAGRAAIREGRVNPGENVETIFAERRAASMRKAAETGS